MSSALNIVKASFGGLREVATAPLWQWDYGQILRITGLDLPQAFEVHFSNSKERGTSKTQIGQDSQVTIPDEYLTSGADVYAFIYLHEGETDGETEYRIKIPVKERPQPTDVEPTPQEQSEITQAIAALNSAVEQTSADVTSADASARAAAQSETNAEESASAAQRSAEAAAGSASTASGAAGTATNKASEASQSASDAEHAKIDAEAAKDSIKDMTASAHTLPSGSSATVTKTEGETTFNLDFGIPKGDKGDKGDPGAKGDKGTTPDFTIGTVQTLPAGSQATASITGTDEEPVLNLGLPKGDTGDVNDVQINGTSIVDNGVANIPLPKVITVTGATPSIAAQMDTQYLCGEVSTLDITLPESGMVDVVFESGATPTVLTVTPPAGQTVRWANDFDATALEANTTYEINILNGLGVAVGWT